MKKYRLDRLPDRITIETPLQLMVARTRQMKQNWNNGVSHPSERNRPFAVGDELQLSGQTMINFLEETCSLEGFSRKPVPVVGNPEEY